MISKKRGNMSLKSFFTDFKKITGLYSLVFLTEFILIIVLGMVSYIVADVKILLYLFLISFLCIQVYIYYVFQKKLIKKVYNPEFNNNKNIVILIGVIVALIVVEIIFILGMIASIAMNPLSTYAALKFLTGNGLKIIIYIISMAFISLYTYLLFDIKKFSKNILIVLSFFLIGFIVNILLSSLTNLLVKKVAFPLLSIDIFGVILFALIIFIILVLVSAISKTIYVQIVKYYKGDNKIEEKLGKLGKKIKGFFKDLTKK